MNYIRDIPLEIWTNIARYDLRIYNALARLTPALVLLDIRAEYDNGTVVPVKSGRQGIIAEIKTMLGVPHTFDTPHGSYNGAPYICCASYGQLTKFNNELPSFELSVDGQLYVQIHAVKGRLCGAPAISCRIDRVVFEVHVNYEGVARNVMCAVLCGDKFRYFVIDMSNYDVTIFRPSSAVLPDTANSAAQIRRWFESAFSTVRRVTKEDSMSKYTMLSMSRVINSCCGDVVHIYDHLGILAQSLVWVQFQHDC